MMEAKQPPELIELPLASECEHEQIIYWHARGGEAEGVHLHKSIEEIHFDMWIPLKVYKQPWPGRRSLSERDMELAVAKAYVMLTKTDRSHEKANKTVTIQGHPEGVHVTLGVGVFDHKQTVWKDDAGRIW